VAARLLALGLLAPWRHRMTACGGLAFTTTVRVVDRVHDDTTNGRADTAPTHCTGFTNLAQAVLGIADFADSRTAFDVNAANLAGTQANLCVRTFTRHQHNAGTSRTCNLC